jgi:hypothetical protein
VASIIDKQLQINAMQSAKQRLERNSHSPFGISHGGHKRYQARKRMLQR